LLIKSDPFEKTLGQIKVIGREISKRLMKNLNPKERSYGENFKIELD